METQSMPTKTKQLPFKTRVQRAVTALFASSDLAAPDDFTTPSSIDRRKNTLVEQFGNERTVLWAFARAHVVKQAAEAAFKQAKADFCELFSVSEDAGEPGSEFTLTRDDVSCLVKVTQPQHRLDRGLLRTELMTQCKLSAEKADALLKKCEKAGKPPVYLTPTVNN